MAQAICSPFGSADGQSFPDLQFPDITKVHAATAVKLSTKKHQKKDRGKKRELLMDLVQKCLHDDF